ncbi:transcriptional elongation factor [Canarypox virus]|uniref:Late transcription elongation factor OPG087 n=1 Tax=Canarypox virus TaxID=44088 RepID=Q6VZP2_CNPV|nr:transcriptional elongation factor [Canarypox virus]AAR83451.1 CNPV106 putative elongation factor [Canarypox virus]AWD84581.1 transcriptional elongation factor [Canarypox virus]
MSFRELIYYNLLKYLVSGDTAYMEKFVSLCDSFGIDRVKMLSKFYNSRKTKLITNALKCNTYLDELELSYPDDIIKDLVTLKLNKFTKTIKRSYKLPNRGSGIAIIYDNTVKYNVDDEILSYLKLKYLPSIYTYFKEDTLSTEDIPRDSVILIFDQDSISYFTYISCKKIVSNTDIKITVTEDCINKLLDEKNKDLLDSVFANRSNNVLSNTLNEIYSAVMSSLYLEDSISFSS